MSDMQINWLKLSIWIFVAFCAIEVLLRYSSAPPPPPPPPAAPSVVTAPVTKPPPPVAAPIIPPAALPKGTTKKKGFQPRPINMSPGCQDVPSAAFRHPLDVVLDAARRMEVDPWRIDILERCWNGEDVR